LYKEINGETGQNKIIKLNFTKMRKKILLIINLMLIVHCTLKIEDCMCQWIQCNGPFNDLILSIALNGSNVVVGTDNSVMLSTNNGQNWSQIGSGTRVNSIVYIGSNLFAGTSTGVWLTTNFGQNWTLTSLTMNVNCLAVNVTNIFAGTYSGVYLSTNNGQNWIQTSLNDKEILALTVNGNNVIAGTNNYGVYLSTNNGTNWTQTYLNNKTIPSLAISGSNIFAGTSNDGVYISTNNGGNWNQTALNDKYILSLAIEGNNIYAGSYFWGVYFSSNNGTNWVPTGIINYDNNVHCIGINGLIIFTGGNNGLIHSIDGGQNWIQTGFQLQNITSFTLNGSNLFAGTNTNGAYISTNFGITWSKTILYNWLNSVRALSSSGNKVFAGGSDFYYTTNNGDNWSSVGLYTIISSICSKDNYILAGCDNFYYGKGIYCSTNYGQNWTFTYIGFVKSVVMSNSNFFAGKMYYNPIQGGVSKSTNFGLNWIPFGLESYTINSLATIDSSVFAGTEGLGVYYYQNSAQPWIQTSMNNKTVYSLLAIGNNIFAGTKDSGTYYSTNNGANWLQMNQGMGNKTINALIIADDNLFAGTEGYSVWKYSLSNLLPSLPVLYSPIYGSINVALTPILDWSDVSTALNYKLQVSTDSGFINNVVNDSSISISQYTINTGKLNTNTKYYWRIKAKNNWGWGSYSSTWNFTTIPPTPVAPQLLSPFNGSIDISLTPSLDWNDVQYADNYRAQISVDSLFGTNAFDSSGMTVSNINIPSGKLTTLTKYYWRINASNIAGTGAWSSVWNFTTIPNAPNIPLLSQPANGSTSQPINITFKWYKAIETFSIKNEELRIKNEKAENKNKRLNSDLSPDAISKYWFEYCTDSTFTTGVVRDSTLADTTKSVSGLSNITKYFWRVKAKNQSGWGNFSSVWNFTTIVPIPSAPILISPTTGSVDIPLTPTLDWGDVTYAASYRMQISIDSLFGTALWDTTGLTISQVNVPSGKLSTLTKYYWRVNASNVAGTGSWSLVWNFKTIPNIPSAPALYQPTNGATGQPINITFKWYKAIETLSIKNEGLRMKNEIAENKNKRLNSDFSPDAISKYWFEYSTDSTFATGVVRDTTLTDTTKSVTGLANITKYFWRVKAKNQSGWGVFSSVWNFTTIVAVPFSPTLITPSNNTSGISLTPTMDWNDVSYATSYRLQISTDSLFGSTQWDTTGVTISQVTVPTGKLTGLTKYYWRINATNVAGTSPWSTVWNFTTLQNLSINLKLYLEGFWNGSSQVTDTVRIYLAMSISPFTFKDSAKVVLSSTGTTIPTFTKAANGSYYIVVIHRNHLETWSKLPQSFTTGTPVNYDFTTAATKAFGDNMKQVGSVWVLYGGDPNQDGEVGAFDIPIFISQFGQQGYLSCDFNGDEDVNGFDVQIISANFGLTKAVPTLDYIGNRNRNNNIQNNKNSEKVKKSESEKVKK
jgi:hypothetical protein